MAHSQERAEAIRVLSERLRGIETAMLTTMEPDGSLLSRPMVAQKLPFDGDLWFLARSHSRLVWDVQRHPRVNLNYVALNHDRFISLSGTAHIVRDRRKASQLWDPSYDSWFAGGVDDPELVLVKVTIDFAQAWGSPPGVTERFEGLLSRG
jgi:general stress protein 26